MVVASQHHGGVSDLARELRGVAYGWVPSPCSVRCVAVVLFGRADDGHHNGGVIEPVVEPVKGAGCGGGLWRWDCSLKLGFGEGGSPGGGGSVSDCVAAAAWYDIYPRPRGGG